MILRDESDIYYFLGRTDNFHYDSYPEAEEANDSLSGPCIVRDRACNGIQAGIWMHQPALNRSLIRIQSREQK